MIYHLVTSLEARISHLSDRILLVERLLSGDDRGVRGEREVDTREAGRIERVRDRDMTQQNPTYGTRLVWNSLRSTLRLPSNRREAVTLETT